MVRPIQATVTHARQSEAALPRSLFGSALLGLLVTAMAFAGIALVNETFATLFLIYVVAVVGLGTFMGNAGVFSFGHAGFMAVGAYVSGILSMDPGLRRTVLPRFPATLSDISIPFELGALSALAVVALFAGLVGLAVSRLPTYAAGIATLGILIIVQTALLAADEVTNGASPLYGIEREVDWLTALVVAVAAITVARVYRDSRPGRQLRSSREDALAAQAVGVNVTGRRFQAWVLSAVITGAAGILLAHSLAAVSPSQFYLTLTIALVAMLILGGATTVSGAVVGTALVSMSLEGLSRIENGANLGPLHLPAFLGLPTLGLSVVFIIALYFRREGVMGRYEIDELVGRWFRGSARADVPPRLPAAGPRATDSTEPAGHTHEVHRGTADVRKT